MTKFYFAFCVIFANLMILTMSGCISRADKEVVVYAALDKEFSNPILSDFESEFGIKVQAKYDVESNKTVGLATEIIQTADKPRADIFWNNEILHTLRLKKLGLVDTYTSPLAANYPKQFYSQEGEWHGFAARARVLIVNTDRLPDPANRPDSILDLIDPKWKSNCGMAKPLFGTTATQAAVLFSEWGEAKATDFFTKAKENANIESGNKQVAVNVARGTYAWGITDTDDAMIEIDAGKPVIMIFPDQGDDESGTLLIPNTLCIIKNGPNSEHAKKLVDYLLQASVEDRLAEGRSAQFPLSKLAETRSRAKPDDLKVMQVDFEAAAENWDAATNVLTQLFQ